MPSITNQTRRELQSLISEEVMLVQSKAAKEAEEQWQQAEHDVARLLGHDGLLVRIEHLKNQIEGLQQELRDLESTISERAKPASVQDFRNVGIDVRADQYGNIWNKPIVFDRQIKTVWDCMVLKHLNEQVPFFQIHVNLAQLHHTMRRELLMCGTFNEVRALYQRFHEKIGLAIGTELPGLLAEVQSLPALQKPLDDSL